ncbi:MAG: chromosome segregation protein SMC, partial [Chloroflexota bacterium]
VMGETRPTSVRGSEMDDVIFAGSAGRAGLGMAEVKLTLDNTAGWIPLDFSEVTIARRAHRSGENEYFINGARVRLRDVVELRNRAGFGQSSYSVIGQGLIDQVLSQRPDERRALFEEAAGIRHYQAKRDQTLEQLAATRQNLQRVADVIAEVAPRVQHLRQQAEKMHQHANLTQELRDVQVRWFGARHRAVHAQAAQTQEALADARQALATSTTQLAEAEQLIASLSATKQALDSSLAAHVARLAELDHRRQQLQGAVELTSDKLTFMEQQGSDAELELADLAAQRQRLEAERNELAAQATRLTDGNGARAVELHRADAFALQRAGELEACDRAARHTADNLAGASADLAQRQKEAAELERRLSAFDAQLQQHGHDAQGKAGLIGALNERLLSLRAELDRIRGEEEMLSGQREASRLDLAAMEQELAARHSRQYQLERVRGEVATRKQLMEEMQLNLEGLGEAAKALIQGKQPGVLGAMVDHIRVEPGWERAIGAALGHKLQAVLVEDEAAALQALAHLPGGGGALAFGPWPMGAPPLPVLPAGLTAAAAVVQGSHPALLRILADVTLAPDLRTALRHKAAATRLVTREGDVLEADGTIIRPGASPAEAVLRRRRELEELAEQLAEQDTALAEAQVQVLEASSRREAQTAEARRLEGLAAELNQQRQQRLNESREVGHQVQAARAQGDWIASLVENLTRERQQLEGRRVTLSAEIDQLSARVPELRRQLHEQQTELDEAKLASQEAADQPRRLRLEMAGASQQLQALQGQLRSSEQSSANLHHQEQARQQRLAERAEVPRQLRAQLAQHQAQLEQVEGQRERDSRELPPLRTRAATLEGELAELRASETSAREAQVEQDKRAYRCAFEAQHKREELEALSSALWEELQLTPDVLPGESTAPEPPKREVDALKARLAAIGPVNPEALAEFEEARARHQFLTEQSADLEGSARQLGGVIHELEELTNRQFRETFEAVAVEFQRCFQTMFNGGQVHLSLVDPENVTTSGVEILAQPPGKRLQSLAALSGGERALVAASLLFAILTVRPVPFCLLDEVDAALDEANVTRFCRALRGLAQQTQFVLITHNRETMAMADAIYGVSMNQDGVSRVLSMRLATAAATLAPQAPAPRPDSVAAPTAIS